MKVNLIQNISSKTYNIITVLTSAVLTELCIGIFNSTDYKIDIYNLREFLENPSSVNPDIQVVEQGNNILSNSITVLVVFSFFHLIQRYLIPLFISLYDRLRYRGKKKYTKAEILSVYQTCKKNVLSAIYTCHNTPASNTLYFENIATELNQLHHIFCTSNKNNKEIIKSTFRINNGTLSDVGNFISSYDLLALFQAILQYFDTIHGLNPMLDFDINIAEHKINDIKNNLKNLGINIIDNCP